MKPAGKGHGDYALEAILLVGFLLGFFLLFFVNVPEPNKEQFAQAQGALIVIVTLIAKSLWERRGARPSNGGEG